MGKLSNVIFYLNSWGTQNVVKKEHDVDKVPDVGEIIVLMVEDRRACI